MSYAGTYGPDETCRHDTYWRSCSDCSLVGPKATEEEITAARFNQKAWNLANEKARARKQAERHTSTVVRDGFGRIINEKQETP
jgi:ribosome-binding protein aMBF1 (putative translation factor)